MPVRRDTENSAGWAIEARSRLALRCAEKPATKAGQIRALWPDIEAALDVGQSMKSICRWLEEDAGIALAVTTLTSYISRIRRRQAAANRHSEASVEQLAPPQMESTPALSSPRMAVAFPACTQMSQGKTGDPLAQAMRVLSKPKLDIRKIHNDGDPEGRNLI